MASDEDLQRLREKRLLELQAQQNQAEDVRRVQQEAEAQKQALLRRILTPEARQRMTNVRIVRPEYAEQLELQLRAENDDGESAIRAEAPSPFAPGYEDAVAEYYRRLSRTPEE